MCVCVCVRVRVERTQPTLWMTSVDDGSAAGPRGASDHGLPSPMNGVSEQAAPTQPENGLDERALDRMGAEERKESPAETREALMTAELVLEREGWELGRRGPEGAGPWRGEAFCPPPLLGLCLNVRVPVHPAHMLVSGPSCLSAMPLPPTLMCFSLSEDDDDDDGMDVKSGQQEEEAMRSVQHSAQRTGQHPVCPGKDASG